MKKSSAVLAVMLGILVFMTGCHDKKDYDVFDYVKLGKYKGIEYTPASAEVTDADVDQAIDDLLASKATIAEVTDRPVQTGDTVNIDYAGKIDGVAFDGGTASGQELTIGSGSFIDGFEDQLIGANIGETRDLHCTFPDPYKNNPDLAGKEAVFTVTVNAISESVKPELTDAFIAENTDSETIAAYREATMQSLRESKAEEAKTTDYNTIWATVVENAKISGYPEWELEETTNQMMESYENIASQYQVDLETFATSYMGTTKEALEKQAAQNAKSSVGNKMILRAIAEKEKISVSEEEYAERIQDYMKDAQFASTEEFEEYYGKETVELQLLLDKVMEFLAKEAVAK